MSSLTISAVAERTPYRDGVGDFNFVVKGIPPFRNSNQRNVSALFCFGSGLTFLLSPEVIQVLRLISKIYPRGLIQ